MKNSHLKVGGVESNVTGDQVTIICSCITSLYVERPLHSMMQHLWVLWGLLILGGGGGVKQAMGPCCSQYKTIVCFFSALSLPLAQFIFFFSKRLMMPRHIFMLPITHFGPLSQISSAQTHFVAAHYTLWGLVVHIIAYNKDPFLVSYLQKRGWGWGGPNHENSGKSTRIVGLCLNLVQIVGEWDSMEMYPKWTSTHDLCKKDG
jgi:hypothetical protein